MRLLTPQWPAPATVRAICSTRDGGVSAPPWDSLNLGDHVGDDPACVAENRRRYAARTRGARTVFLRQVHGTRVVRLTPATGDGTEADACLCTEPGLACTILVADCLPVLLCSRSGDRVAAAHAGWRGLCGSGGMAPGEGVLETTVRALQAGDTGVHLLAWLGPCIGPRRFEVGPEVREAFASHDAGASAFFKPHDAGKWLADLPGLARRRLAALGVGAVFGNDGSDAWCTVTQRSRFFSHRRDGVSGRFAASIWRVR